MDQGQAQAAAAARHRRGDELVQAGRQVEAIPEYVEAGRLYMAGGKLLKAIAVSKLATGLELAAAEAGAGAGAAADPASLIIDLEEVEEIKLDEARIPLFFELPREALGELVERAPLRSFGPDQAIVREGQPGTSMFVLVQGAVIVSVADKAVAAMGEGSFFGEIALMSDAPRLATVTTADECLLLEIDRGVLQDLGRRWPSVNEIVERFYRDRLLANLMRVNDLFKGIPAAHKAEVAERFVTRSWPAGELVCREGTTGDGLYVILRGRCEVSWHAGEGEVFGPVMREGDVFGEISLLSEGRTTATVRTQAPCVFLYMSVADFRVHVLTHSDVRYNLGKLGHERLERTTSSRARVSGVEEIPLSDYLI
jgi:cAMP-dependent protein kinase regulator